MFKGRKNAIINKNNSDLYLILLFIFFKILNSFTWPIIESHIYEFRI
jgi:hypothetical protein